MIVFRKVTWGLQHLPVGDDYVQGKIMTTWFIAL